MNDEKNKIIVEEEIEANISESVIDLSEEVIQSEEEHKEVIPNSDEAPKTKSFSKKALLTILFILLNAVAIMATALMDFGGDRQIEPIGTVMGTFLDNWLYGAIAIGLFFLALICEGSKRAVLLTASLKHKGLFKLGINTAVISKYYDYITPFGTGGQPMEIYYMRKKGVPGSIASGITITCYALGLFATVFITLIMIIWKGFLGVSTVIEIMAIIGLVANIFVPLGVLGFSIMPKVGDFLAKLVSKILGVFHLAKNTEKFRENAVNSIKEYASCIIYFFGKYSFATLLVFLLGMCYNIAIYSVPYFIIRLCGVSAEQIDYFTVFTLCLICFSTITIIPTPGNSGAAEISFYSIFSSYLASLGAGVLFWGVLSWRIVTYYLFILSGIVLMIVEKIIGKRHHADLERRDGFGHTAKPASDSDSADDASKEISASESDGDFPPADYSEGES